MNNTTSMDETVMVKGCLGLLNCGKKGKASGKKTTAAAEGKDTNARNPVTVCSPKATKPSAAVLPSPRHNLPQIQRQELKPINTTTTSTSKLSRQDAIKGQLQLGFHVDGATILVQVFEAKNLKFRTPFTVGDGCYVAVELISKSEESKRQTTKAVLEKSPVFNEEFVLRMKNGSNESARLIISVYKTNSSNGSDEMAGCMSFGIAGLQEKCTSNTDTYYLLNRTLGMKKHLRTSQGKHLNLLANTSGVSSLSSLMNKQTNSLLLRTTNISKQRDHQRRFRNVSQFTVPAGSITDETDLGYSNLPSDSLWSYQMAVYNHNYPQRLNSTTKLSTPRRDNAKGDSTATASDLHRIASDLDSCSLSSISLCDLTSSPGQASFNKFRIIHGPDGQGEPQDYPGSDDEGSSGSSLKLSDFHYDSSDVDRNSKISALFFDGSSSTSSLRLSDFTDTSGSTNPDVSCKFPAPAPSVPHGMSKEDELCLQLIHAEDKFVTLMHQGVLRFSRPLRHGILTAFEHQMLFQNVEKLLAISEFHLKKLADCWAKNQQGLHVVGNIYEAQLQMFCEAYKTYLAGLVAADQLLAELLKKPAFVDFLNQDLPGVPNIQLDVFLQTPQNHMQNLICIFEDLVAMARLQQHQSGLQELFKVKSELSICWDQCLKSAEQLYPENHNESYISSEFRKAEQREMNSNISPDLVELEQRIQFPSNVKPSRVAVPGRHIVFSGEVEFIINWKWVNATVFLTNDIMMITQKEADGHITIIAEPINLKDIMTTQFDCKHPCEILLTAKSESRDTAWSHMRTATLRTSTVGEKETWARLIKKCLATTNSERKTSF